MITWHEEENQLTTWNILNITIVEKKEEERNVLPLWMNKNQPHVVSRKQSPKETKKAKVEKGGAGYLGSFYW